MSLGHVLLLPISFCHIIMHLLVEVFWHCPCTLHAIAVRTYNMLGMVVRYVEVHVWGAVRGLVYSGADLHLQNDSALYL